MHLFYLFLIGFLASCSSGGEQSALLQQEIEVPDLPPKISQQATKRGPLADEREFRIALTGALRGEVQPCGCPTLPYGGFARRELYLKDLQGEGFPVFQLDAGEALLKGVSQHGRRDAVRRGTAILEMMSMIGIDVMTLGPTDLIAYATLENFSPQDALVPPLLSGGWVAETSVDFPKAELARVVERGGIRLGVIGVSGGTSGPEIRDQFRREDVVSIARKGVAMLPDNLDLILALGSLNTEEANQLAAEVDELGMILMTAESGEGESFRTHSGVLVVETPPRGRYVTTLRIRMSSTADHEFTVSGSEHDAYASLLERRAQAVALSREGLSPEKTEALASAESELDSLTAGLNLVEVVDRPLGSRFKGETSVDSLLTAFLADLIDEAEQIAAPVVSEVQPERFGTPSACVSCHVQEFAQWAYTDHKQATATLVERSEHKNPECLSCHSTGFGEPGGFGEPTPFNLGRFGGVQCESCHGPLAGHPEEDDIAPQSIEEETCLRCHDEANSPEFSYEEYKRKIRCNRG